MDNCVEEVRPAVGSSGLLIAVVLYILLAIMLFSFRGY